MTTATKKVVQKRIALVLEKDLHAGIEAARAELEKRVGLKVTLSDIVRQLLTQALESGSKKESPARTPGSPA